MSADDLAKHLSAVQILLRADFIQFAQQSPGRVIVTPTRMARGFQTSGSVSRPEQVLPGQRECSGDPQCQRRSLPCQDGCLLDFVDVSVSEFGVLEEFIFEVGVKNPRTIPSP